MSKIITVCGEIPPEELGYTSMHDHTLVNSHSFYKAIFGAIPGSMKEMLTKKRKMEIAEEAKRRSEAGIGKIPAYQPGSMVGYLSLPKSHPASALSDEEYYINELKEFKARGGHSMCDCLPIPLSDVPLKQIQELSKKSGVNLIACTGFYIKSAIPVSFEKKGEDFMQSWLEQQIKEGDGTCDARPGFVKCAISVVNGDQIGCREWMAVRACAKAAKKFGMCLEVHSSFTMPAELLLKTADMLKDDIGIDPAKVVFCHMDARNSGSMNPGAKINEYGVELELPVKLLEKGFNIGLDTWSAQSDDRANSEYYRSMRKKMLVDLIHLGYTSQIVLGHDMVRKANGVQNQCGGYTAFPDSLRELEKDGKLTEETVKMLTVHNPARILQIG